LNNCFSENALKSKLKTIWEFGHAFGIVGKHSMNKVQSRCFEIFLSLEIQLNYKKMILEARFNWVIISHFVPMVNVTLNVNNIHVDMKITIHLIYYICGCIVINIQGVL